MYNDIKTFIKSCKSCQLNKTSPKTKMPLKITTSNKPFEKASLDIAGPFAETENGNKYILTIIDPYKIFGSNSIKKSGCKICF